MGRRHDRLAAGAHPWADQRLASISVAGPYSRSPRSTAANPAGSDTDTPNANVSGRNPPTRGELAAERRTPIRPDVRATISRRAPDGRHRKDSLKRGQLHAPSRPAAGAAGS